MRVIDRLRSEDDTGEPSPGGVPGCGCEPRFEDGRLVVDAGDCPADGDLVDSEACRATAIGALADRDAEVVLVRSHGLEWTYEGPGGTLLVAAGRFAAAIEPHDARLADLARRDPLRAARDAAARSTPASRLAAETGLLLAAEGAGCESVVAGLPDYGTVLDPFVCPAIARSRIGRRPPEGGRLRSARELDTDGVARVYDTDTGPIYHLEPVEARFDPDEASTLADARERMATGADVAGPVDDEGRIPREAVAAVAGDGDPVETVARVLEKHTRGYGVLSDLFADPRVSDVFATAPVEENSLRVVVDGQPMRTNVRLTADGARTLASRLRRESGRAFSRAAPTLDATAETDHGRIRVAGLSDPASDGVAFAFRDHGRRAWTLPALVENGTLTPRVAGFLSVAVERDAAGLVAGTRGAGKTTLLGALLWELPPATRTVVIEDTPELPVDALTDAGRDVQGIRTSLDDGPSIPPAEALRTALRLGDGALVLGEVRSEEAAVLYEAMRVGASANATLGTIHGDGADAVRERVVSDLEVPASSFGATDLVVTVRRQPTPSGPSRQVGSVEEVVADGEDVGFAPLFEPGTDGARPTGRADRGDSVLVSDLSRPGESYADVLTAVEDRAESLSAMARRGRTDAGTVASAYASRRR